MKRVVLVLFSVAAVAAIATGVLSLDGPARLLVVAGACIVLVAAVDEFRATAPKPLTASDAPIPTEQALAQSPVPEHALAEPVIDLRDRPLTLVDELIADGKLSNSREPITDGEVPAIVMAAFADQLSLRSA